MPQPNPYLTTLIHRHGGGAPRHAWTRRRKPWDPGVLPDLTLWLDASNLYGVADGAAVTTWADRSRGSWHATVEGTGNTPTYSASGGPGGRPCLVFDGSPGAYGIDSAAVAARAAAEAWIVLKDDADPPADGSRSCPWGFGSSLADSHLPFENGLIYDDFGSTARHNGIAYAGSLADWSVYSATSADGSWSNRRGGVELYSTAAHTVGWLLPKVWVGCSVHPTVSSYTGRVAELVLLGRVATADEEASLASYFQSKYGL